MAAYCVTESVAGSDVAGIKTRAEKKGDEYVINGSKMWITNGGVANWYFLLARTDPNPKTPAGKAFTAFAFDADLPGIIKKKEIHMEVKCADNCRIFFEDVCVPVSQIVENPGEGFKVAMKTFDLTRPLVAASAVGLIGRCLDEATKYALKKNIYANQVVSFKLADMASKMKYSRLMTLKAVFEIQSKKLGSLYPSMAKKIASEAAVEVAMNCVEICGHDGCNTDYPIEKLLRDSKVLTIGEGTSEMQKLMIGRELIQKIQKNRSYFLHV